MSAPFHFKQFSIVQEHTPMKVGTDGVLLGAWLNADGAQSILDIGTGTGLIALMLAQRFPKAKITAIDAHPEASMEARANFKASRFSDRIEGIHIDIKDFEPGQKFDLIVSNPPFFKSSLHAPNQGRSLARHDIGFSAEDFAKATAWLSPGGILSGIYPVDIFEHFNQILLQSHMQLTAKCTVQSTPAKHPHRVLFAYRRSSGRIENLGSENIIIEAHGRHQYSDSYKMLTKDFYLGF